LNIHTLDYHNTVKPTFESALEKSGSDRFEGTRIPRAEKRPKKPIKNLESRGKRQENVFFSFVGFELFQKSFWHGLFQKKIINKKVYGVFELPLSLLRNAQKRHKKKLPTWFSGYLPDVRGFNFCSP
jgi:hypothetical protein